MTIHGRDFYIGKKLYWYVNEFDSVNPAYTPCTVTEVGDDYAIATEDCAKGRPMSLWIDGDTAKQYIDRF